MTQCNFLFPIFNSRSLIFKEVETARPYLTMPVV